jgi:hypothetical protein
MKQTATDKIPRRRFMRAAVSTATVTCLPSSLWSGDRAISGPAQLQFQLSTASGSERDSI